MTCLLSIETERRNKEPCELHTTRVTLSKIICYKRLNNILEPFERILGAPILTPEELQDLQDVVELVVLRLVEDQAHQAEQSHDEQDALGNFLHLEVEDRVQINRHCRSF